MSTEQRNNQSVERAVLLLRAFLDGRSELRVSDIERLTGIRQSTVSRLLATLEELGLVIRDDVTGLYRPGLDLLSYASVVLNAHPVHQAGRQVAQTLAGELGLGANLAVRDGTSMLYLCNFEGPAAAKAYSLMGQRKPLHATGLGKCLLLGLDPDQRGELLGTQLQRYTAHTLTDPRDLESHLSGIAERGYATEVEELALGRACIAAPIRDAQGSVQAAISISGPLSAIDLSNRESELSRIAIEASDSIAMGLGYLVPVPTQAVPTVREESRSA